tara:strand:+ start:50 stop:754 length:705 start_codon:yes stop_codon:yes gene_type:complete
MRTVVITGSNRGIGAAVAHTLLQQGHRVCLAVREPERLLGTDLDPGQAPEKLIACPYDARVPEDAQRIVERALTHFGSLDTLIHCAGILRRTPLLFSEEQRHEPDKLWSVNVMGPWWLTRAAWPALVESGRGRIQVLVSMSGKRCKGTLAGYTASKFALMGLCQAMRNEGWDQGIRVTAVCPGWVNTEMAAGVKTMPPEQMTQPQDLASLCAHLLTLPSAAVPFECAVNASLER